MSFTFIVLYQIQKIDYTRLVFFWTNNLKEFIFAVVVASSSFIFCPLIFHAFLTRGQITSRKKQNRKIFMHKGDKFRMREKVNKFSILLPWIQCYNSIWFSRNCKNRKQNAIHVPYIVLLY